MIFASHTLQVKVTTQMETDEFGRPIPGTGGESWQDVCKCRCDDNSTKEFTSENGEVYRPNYHVVCEKKISLKAGDEVRCMEGENIRGDGKVYKLFWLLRDMDMTRAEEVVANKQLRKEIDEKIQAIRSLPPSRERSLAITKLQEGVMWLGMDLKRLNETNPYPSSKDPSTGDKIEPTADGLKL